MTDRRGEVLESESKFEPEPGDFIDGGGPGSDPGAAYERAAEHDDGGGLDAVDGEEPPSPAVGDVYRSGS